MFIKILQLSLLFIVLFVLFITFAPGWILLDVNPESHDFPLPESFTGNLYPNNDLSRAEKLYQGKLHGPESIAEYRGKIYTSSHDGFIYNIDDDDWLVPIVKLVDNTGKKCNSKESESSCPPARPLGMKFNTKGLLYVVEPSVGIFSVNFSFSPSSSSRGGISSSPKPQVRNIFPIEKTSSLGEESLFLDDLAIHEGGGLNGGDVLYISDVSSKFPLSGAIISLLASDPGRLIKYDINADKVETVADEILFPNGVEINDDASGILFCALTSRELFKYHISGRKAGKTELLADSLPGEPDNIRRSASKDETYWIALTSARNQDTPNYIDRIQRWGLVRKFVLRSNHIIGSIVESIGRLFGSDRLKEYGRMKKTSWYIFTDMTQSYGMVIEVDKNGKIINSLHSPDGSVTLLSEVREIRLNERETVLYLGSAVNDYLGKMKMKR